MNKNDYLNFFYYLFGFKKIRNRMLFVFVICAHLAGWLIFFSLPLLFFRIEINDNIFWYRELINKIFLVSFFYINYFFLINRFFIKGKRTTYFLLVLLCIILLFVQQLIVERKIFERFPGNASSPFRTISSRNKNFRPYFDGSRDSSNEIGPFPRFRRKNEHLILNIPERPFFMTLTNALSSAFVLLLLGAFIYLLYYFIKSQDEKKSLENAGLQAEVNLLKSQINPHFLFNTLNSIYAQAYQKSENTEKSILKLSEILRYMIYDTTTESIELQKDIDYLTSYIDLQRLRLTSKVTINYTVKGKTKDLSIAPLLLITFIENAFKHGISYTHSSVITISIEVFDKTLTLFVSNPVVTSNKFEHGGIGLKNVARRLDLLYRDKYSIEFTNNDNLYIVHLKINLT
ncbi:MAG TPA: histidine kinase [Flavisolibacter sp.]|nr:histidine kinase [Flavisolibacter sp.]